MTDSCSALVLLSDLMFQVKIAEAAKQAGVRPCFVNSSARLLQLAGEEQPRVIILDINFAAAEPLKVIQALKAESKTKDIPLIGYVSHVQVELRAAAAAAGCDVVLARSAFVQNLNGLLAQYANTGAELEPSSAEGL